MTQLCHVFRLGLITDRPLCLLLSTTLLPVHYDGKQAYICCRWTNHCLCSRGPHGNGSFFKLKTRLTQVLGSFFKEQLGWCPQQGHPAAAKYAPTSKQRHKCTGCNYCVSVDTWLLVRLEACSRLSCSLSPLSRTVKLLEETISKKSTALHHFLLKCCSVFLISSPPFMYVI